MMETSVERERGSQKTSRAPRVSLVPKLHFLSISNVRLPR